MAPGHPAAHPCLCDASHTLAQRTWLGLRRGQRRDVRLRQGSLETGVQSRRHGAGVNLGRQQSMDVHGDESDLGGSGGRRRFVGADRRRAGRGLGLRFRAGRDFARQPRVFCARRLRRDGQRGSDLARRGTPTCPCGFAASRQGARRGWKHRPPDTSCTSGANNGQKPDGRAAGLPSRWAWAKSRRRCSGRRVAVDFSALAARPRVAAA